MDITILGARGSVPVNGKDMLEFGGSTSCVMIEEGENVIFLDAGTGIMSTPDIGDRSIHIVLTHPHADHLIGLPFFPYIYEKDRQIDIYAVPREGLDTFAQVTKLISRPLWAVRVDEYASDVRCHDVTGPFKIGNVSIAMTESDHPGGSSIIRLTCGRSSLVYATDYEHSEEGDARLIDFSRDADLLLYDGQYTEEEYKTKARFGHSTPGRGVKIMEKCGARMMRIVHHDPRHTDEVLLRMEEQIRTDNIAFARQGEKICLPE